MAIEAPYSKYNKTNFKIGIVLCIGLAIIFAYDGYLSKYEWSLRRSFYEEHVIEGKPDGDMVFNQKSPFFFVALAAVITVCFLARKNKRLLADGNELIISAKEKISYDSIQKINKTHFDKKGFFVLTYKNENGNEVNRKISNRKYDNLAAIVDHLVAKIS
ncbi:MAG: hypothetical protein ACYS80_06195 [Planctomycetota bacterium]|jgi:hypothetical protein